MKSFIKASIFLFFFSFISCSDKSKTNNFDVEPQIILKSFKTWWNYNAMQIVLSSDFNAIDDNSQKISKKIFLQKLKTGHFIPIKLLSNDSANIYQLYKLQQDDSKEIERTIKQIAAKEYGFFEKEGTSFPEYNFTDIEGKLFNKETTKGKYLILKCWFIRCYACVEEMPELNKIVEKYKSRNDLSFVSLALDSKKQLQKFRTKREFKYAIVPNQEKFIINKLNIQEFPAHIIVDKNGKIVKIVNSQKELELQLKNIFKF